MEVDKMLAILWKIIKIIIVLIILYILSGVFSGIKEAESRRRRENRVIKKYANEAYKNSKAYWKEVKKLQRKRKYNLISQPEFMEIRRELDKKYEQQEYVGEHTERMLEEIDDINKEYDWYK